MDKEKVRDLPRFIDSIDFFSGDYLGQTFVFRGQPYEGNLLPRIARGNNTLEIEQKIIKQLELVGASLIPEGNPQKKLDTLVLAQHYGLKTRLLDWTTNPLAALWFACSAKKKGDVYVYVLETSDLLVDDAVYNNDPFSEVKTRVFQPRLNNPRIIAQHGWFTLHGRSKKTGNFTPLESDPEVKEHLLQQFQIPEDIRYFLLNSLDLVGIGFRTLYPDLEGLCSYLNWKYTDDLPDSNCIAG
jgi:hypothetical protein